MHAKTATCPNCSLANPFLAEPCIQCGIHFSRYFTELEKAEATRRQVEAKASRLEDRHTESQTGSSGGRTGERVGFSSGHPDTEAALQMMPSDLEAAGQARKPEGR